MKMKTQTTLLLALLGVSLTPLALYALPSKTAAKKVPAKPVLEYCVLQHASARGKIYNPDGTETDLNANMNPAQELTKLARSGWRVVSASSSTSSQFWTLERRR